MGTAAAPAAVVDGTFVASPDDSLDSVLDRAVADHPAPSPIADELIAEAQAENAAQPVDVQRTQLPPGFNPDLHVWPPTKTARGTWRKLRSGQTNPPAVVAQLAPKDDAAGDVAAATPAAAADAMCATFFALAAAMIGPEWHPTDEERTAIVDALTRYYATAGVIDLPPGVALALAVGAYAVPRAMLPATRQRIAKLIGAVTGRKPNPIDNANAQPAADNADGAAPAAPRPRVGLAIVGSSPSNTPADNGGAVAA
jgi:hypothetical protein